ncbi:MAG: proteasome-activating nucleotidase [Acidilobaceae archaeon]|nr:proteasome-activating nucleotidase [Acidilobaceae archaeon]
MEGEEEVERKLAILKEKVRTLTQRITSLESELEYYRNEVMKLLSPPLIEAVVLEKIDDERYLVKSSSGPNFIVNVAEGVDKRAIRAGSTVALNGRGSTIVSVLPNHYDPLVRGMIVEERPKVGFRDVGGLADQIRELYEAVVLPIKKPELFSSLGIEPPKGVLLHGLPGTGKTLLARAVAGEIEATFIRLSGSELVNKFIGEGARLVREVFRLARERVPAIVFIDEIDAIGARRTELGTSGEREVNRTLLQLLVELDGFEPLSKVKVIAATNRIDILDPALMRPGRFDRVIELPLPDMKGRLEILKIHTRKMSLGESVDLEEIARLTEGFSGADLKALVTEAAYFTIRRNSRVPEMEDFLKALQKLRKGARPQAGNSMSI